MINPWRSEVLDDLFGRPLVPMRGPYPSTERWWIPDVDIYDKDGMLVIETDLPGIEEKNVDVSISGDILTIKGEKKAENEVEEKGYYQYERTYGSFSRSVTLPTAVDADKIEANFEDGVLEIHLPKLTEAKPKKVKVSAKKK
jgi:HSP20 family protein